MGQREILKGHLKKYSEQNENWNAACWNFWDAVKAGMRRNIMAKFLFRKEENSSKQSVNLPFQEPRNRIPE